jgi:hypothetical protein
MYLHRRFYIQNLWVGDLGCTHLENVSFVCLNGEEKYARCHTAEITALRLVTGKTRATENRAYITADTGRNEKRGLIQFKILWIQKWE